MSTDIITSMEAAGMALHGQEWQRPLARDLGAVRPTGRGGAQGLQQRTLRRWVTGERPPPTWLTAALVTVLHQGAARRAREAQELAALADRITAAG